MSEPDVGGPYLAAALFCVETRVDYGNIYSAIHIVDEVVWHGDRPGDEDRAPIRLFIRLARGTFLGELPFALVIRRPDDSIAAVELPPIRFVEAEPSRSFDLAVEAQVDQPGVYWFAVVLGGRELTRSRLRVRHRVPS